MSIDRYSFIFCIGALICLMLSADTASAQAQIKPFEPPFQYGLVADRLQMNAIGERWQRGAVPVMPSGAKVLSRTVLSMLVGTSLGVAIGYGIDSDIQDSWIGVTDGMMVGAVVGSTVSAPLGAFLTNRRNGNFFLALGATALTSVAAVYLAETNPALAVTALPIVHVGLSVVIIRATE